MNYNDEFTKPLLVEPGVKYFLKETLKQCKEFKDKHHNIIFNIVLFIVFFLILGGLLLYKYKGKLTPEEKVQKDNEKKQYILSKISNYQMEKKRESQELITGLPHWENEYEVIRKRVK
jgi:hypothetical protein